MEKLLETKMASLWRKMKQSKLKLKTKSPVIALDISANGNLLAVAQKGNSNGDPNLTLWDLKSLEIQEIIESIPDKYIDDVSFNRDGTILSYIIKNKIMFYEIRKKKKSQNFIELENAHHVKFSKHNDYLIITGTYIEIWDTDKMKRIWSFEDYIGKGTTENINQDILKKYYKLPERIASSFYNNQPPVAEFLSDSRIIFTGINTSNFCIYEIASNHLLEQFPGGVLQAEYMELDIHENYLFIISKIPDADLCWNFKTKNRWLPDLLNERFYSSACFNFHPSSKVFATGSKNGSVSIRSLKDGKFLMNELLHNGAVNAVKFSPDGTKIISGGIDGAVIIIDISEYL